MSGELSGDRNLFKPYTDTYTLSQHLYYVSFLVIMYTQNEMTKSMWYAVGKRLQRELDCEGLLQKHSHVPEKSLDGKTEVRYYVKHQSIVVVLLTTSMETNFKSGIAPLFHS